MLYARPRLSGNEGTALAWVGLLGLFFGQLVGWGHLLAALQHGAAVGGGDVGPVAEDILAAADRVCRARRASAGGVGMSIDKV